MPNIQINNDKRLRSYAIKIAKNQKVIQIHRKNKTTQTICFKSNKEALRTLSSNGYVLYMYLVMRPDKSVWGLSSKDVYESTCLARRTYEAAIDDLINNGYLVPHDIDSPEYGSWKVIDNAYYFLEDRN